MLLWTFDETLKSLKLLSQALFIHLFFTYQHFYILYELRSATQWISFQGEQCVLLFPAEHLRPLAPLSATAPHLSVAVWKFQVRPRKSEKMRWRWVWIIQTVQFSSANSKDKVVIWCMTFLFAVQFLQALTDSRTNPSTDFSKVKLINERDGLLHNSTAQLMRIFGSSFKKSSVD